VKVLLLLLFISISVNASYNEAKRYFDLKQYNEAIKEAKASKDEYTNPKLHLIWAESAQAIGEIKEAMSAYERVVMLDQDNLEAKFALLKIYNDTDRYILAKDISKNLLNYDLTPSQRSSLALLKGETLNSLKARITLSGGYDTNINVSATSSVLDDYYGSLNEGEVSTLFTRINGSVSYIDDLDQKGGWYLRGDAKFYSQNNYDAHFFDMFIIGAEGGLGYAGGIYTIYLPVGYDKINYLDVNLMSQVKLQPKINITLNNDYILNLNAKYSIKNYQEPKYKGMDDESISGGLGFYYLFGKNFTYLNGAYETYSSRDDNPFVFIDKDILTLSMGVNYHINDLFVTNVNYKYRAVKYDDMSDQINLSDNSKRADDYNQVELKFSYYFKKYYSAYVSNRYIKNSSNYIPGEYKKNITMFGIRANY